jgi:hypothetical protein
VAAKGHPSASVIELARNVPRCRVRRGGRPFAERACPFRMMECHFRRSRYHSSHVTSIILSVSVHAGRTGNRISEIYTPPREVGRSRCRSLATATPRLFGVHADTQSYKCWIPPQSRDNGFGRAPLNGPRCESTPIAFFCGILAPDRSRPNQSGPYFRGLPRGSMPRCISMNCNRSLHPRRRYPTVFSLGVDLRAPPGPGRSPPRHSRSSRTRGWRPDFPSKK